MGVRPATMPGAFTSPARNREEARAAMAALVAADETADEPKPITDGVRNDPYGDGFATATTGYPPTHCPGFSGTPAGHEMRDLWMMGYGDGAAYAADQWARCEVEAYHRELERAEKRARERAGKGGGNA